MKKYLIISLIINMLTVSYLYADVTRKDDNTATITISQDIPIERLKNQLEGYKQQITDIQAQIADIQAQIDAAAKAGVKSAIPLASNNFM